MIIENDKELELFQELMYNYSFAVKLTEGQEEIEKILEDAIEVYEAIHYPIAEPSKEDAEQFRREQLGL